MNYAIYCERNAFNIHNNYTIIQTIKKLTPSQKTQSITDIA